MKIQYTKYIKISKKAVIGTKSTYRLSIKNLAEHFTTPIANFILLQKINVKTKIKPDNEANPIDKYKSNFGLSNFFNLSFIIIY